MTLFEWIRTGFDLDSNLRTDGQCEERFQIISEPVKKFVMKTTHSFAIDFLIRRCKDDKQQALIYARITVDEDRKELSLKERINAVDWDPAKEIVKGKTEQIKSLNKNIEDVRFKIKEK